MTSLASTLAHEALLTGYDIAPIAVIIAVFQAAVFRKPPAHLRRLLIGLFYVAVGLTLFRVGIATSLVPTGSAMAEQLLATQGEDSPAWPSYVWLCLFASLIGFSATLIEPTLIAVADRVRELTGGSVRPGHLRVVVAIGVAFGLLTGVLRILIGVPLALVIAPLVAVIAVLAALSERSAVPLALDSGGVATSVVTVPLITAFGVAVATALPGRDPVADGFGLIVLALLFPMVSVLVFAQLRRLRASRRQNGGEDEVQAHHRAGE